MFENNWPAVAKPGSVSSSGAQLRGKAAGRLWTDP